jgi:hypothetical protein
MEYAFKNGDLVEVSTGPGVPGDRLVGRVVGFYNPTPSDDPLHHFYIVMLEEPIDTWPWSTALFSGAMMKKLTALDEIVHAVEHPCPNCEGESLLEDVQGLDDNSLTDLLETVQQEIADRRETWEDAVHGR